MSLLDYCALCITHATLSVDLSVQGYTILSRLHLMLVVYKIYGYTYSDGLRKWGAVQEKQGATF